MGAVLAARMGDQVGSHPSGFWALVGLIAGAIVGAVVGALLIVATVASGGALLLVAAAVAGSISLASAASAAGERLGEAFDQDHADASATPCSPIVKGCMTVFIENAPAARMDDPAAVCLITHTPAIVKQGSANVYIGGSPASRHNDKVTCTGKINATAKYTYIGGPTAESPEPYQPTFAGAIHEVGTKFEELAEKSGKVALGLAFVAAPFATVAFYYVGKGAAWGGEQLGAMVDEHFGYTDHRFEHFGGVAAGVVLAFAGAKMAHGGEEPVVEGEGGIIEGEGAVAPEEGAPNEEGALDEEGDGPITPRQGPSEPNKVNPWAEEAVKNQSPETQDLVAKSPKAQQQIAKGLSKKGPLKINSDPSKQGAGYNRGSNEITMGDGYDNPQTLAHELGHMDYDPPPKPSTDGPVTRDEWVDQVKNQNLQDEGAAKLNEYEVNDEYAKNGGKPFLEDGADPVNDEIYERYKADEITKDQAQKEMGESFRNKNNSLTGEKYEDYYGKAAQDHWDAEVQPERDIQAARKAEADGKLTHDEAEARVEEARGRQTEARAKAIKRAAQRGEITDQQAADIIRNMRKSYQKMRSQRENVRASEKLEEDFADGKITRDQYDAENARLFAEYNQILKTPAPDPACATCDGAGAPNASDILNGDPPAPAQENGEGGGSGKSGEGGGTPPLKIGKTGRAHVFEGEIAPLKAGEPPVAQGVHTVVDLPPNVKVEPQGKPVSENQTYKAKVTITDDQGQTFEKESTMFPRSWDEPRILQESEAAMNDPGATTKTLPDGGKVITGNSPSGIPIRTYVNPQGDVVSYYPTNAGVPK